LLLLKQNDNIKPMITVVEVNKNPNESNVNLIRRFSRKMQETGVIQKVKSKRYNKRAESKVKIKAAALKRIENRKKREKLFKLGKEIKRGRRSHR
jgi:ribosomal protein S21